MIRLGEARQARGMMKAKGTVGIIFFCAFLQQLHQLRAIIVRIFMTAILSTSSQKKEKADPSLPFPFPISI